MEIDKNLISTNLRNRSWIVFHRRKLEKGEWKKGDKISTEKDLDGTFDESRGTIKEGYLSHW